MIMILRLMLPVRVCSIQDGTPAVARYYRDVMVYVIVVFCLVQFIILLITWPQRLGHLRKQLGMLHCCHNMQWPGEK